uniref:hypothetical protein n=1 Tax=Paenibacillus foliorum TaxID=2654974 RepID=UPI0028B0900C|nr:hypothetical protein [Paenibacillus foliorum]
MQKFRSCGDPRNLVCEGCNDIRRVPYRCIGRFCTTCMFLWGNGGVEPNIDGGCVPG